MKMETKYIINIDWKELEPYAMMAPPVEQLAEVHALGMEVWENGPMEQSAQESEGLENIVQSKRE